MPFNGSNRIEALFAFVDQYAAGDPAMRSGFDQVFGDFVGSVNELATYLEGLTSSGTDQRYLGRVIAVPTQRVDTTPLEAGDFYVAGHVNAGRVGLIYVYDGAAFDVVSDFSTIGDFFKDTLSAAATAAAARSALELGSAATQNTSSFAAASVATDVALAIKLLSDGIAKSMTSNDWDNAHLAGPGTTMVQANAAALNAPVVQNAAGIYVAYDASNGFVLAVAHSTGQIYYRPRLAATWGTWREIATANLTAAEGDILYRGASAWSRLARGTAGQFLRQNSGLTAPEWFTPEPFSATIPTTSGASVDLSTVVPSGVRRIDIILDAVSLSGTDFLGVQVGSGSFASSGYVATGGTGGSWSTSTAMFPLNVASANGHTLTGHITLIRLTGNQWVLTGMTNQQGGTWVSVAAGKVTLGGALDRVRLVPQSANTFDGGQAVISWSF